MRVTILPMAIILTKAHRAVRWLPNYIHVYAVVMQWYHTLTKASM